MREIITTNGVATLVEDEDYDYLNRWKWYCNPNGYICRKFKIDGIFRSVSIHRLILQNHNIFIPSGMEVDHINRNKLDNRFSNLRVCSKTQNRANMPKFRNNTSGARGVWWNKSRNKWEATIKINRKHIYIGLYNNIEDAKNAYNNFSNSYYGEFSYKEIA